MYMLYEGQVQYPISYHVWEEGVRSGLADFDPSSLLDGESRQPV